MKAILFVLLLAVIFCETTNDTIDIVTCVLRSDVLFKAVAQIIEAVRSGDTASIITTLLSLYAPVVAEVKKCLGQ